jgi:hypothetical protein
MEKSEQTRKKEIMEEARRVAFEVYGLPRKCGVCGGYPAQVHHRNRNREDNSRENIEILCPGHHLAAHRPGQRFTFFTPEDIHQMAEEYAKGDSSAVIAERYGTGSSHIMRLLRREGYLEGQHYIHRKTLCIDERC